jgi:hypothetical protein
MDLRGAEGTVPPQVTWKFGTTGPSDITGSSRYPVRASFACSTCQRSAAGAAFGSVADFDFDGVGVEALATNRVGPMALPSTSPSGERWWRRWCLSARPESSDGRAS